MSWWRTIGSSSSFSLLPLSISFSSRGKLSLGKLLIKLPTALPTVCLPVWLRVANKIGFYSNFYELELQPHLKVLQLCVCVCAIVWLRYATHCRRPQRTEGSVKLSLVSAVELSVNCIRRVLLQFIDQFKLNCSESWREVYKEIYLGLERDFWFSRKMILLLTFILKYSNCKLKRSIVVDHSSIRIVEMRDQ